MMYLLITFMSSMTNSRQIPDKQLDPSEISSTVMITVKLCWYGNSLVTFALGIVDGKKPPSSSQLIKSHIKNL